MLFHKWSLKYCVIHLELSRIGVERPEFEFCLYNFPAASLGYNVSGPQLQHVEMMMIAVSQHGFED